MHSIFQKFKYLVPTSVSADGHQEMHEGGRDWENMYRDRWSFDKTVRTTHGVNCTGSCSWNVHVKNGIVAWENQATDYPETAPDMPDFEPRGCPRGTTFSWYLYSPHRVKYPYMRGELAALWREARAKHKTAFDAWKSIASDPVKQKKYKEARGMGGFVRATWEEVSELIASSVLYTAYTYGPDRIFGFSVIPAMSMLSYAAGIRFMQLMGGVGLSFYDWYADLPPASPQIWGEQTDVPESSDWYNAGYLITWGSNVPLTRTPDAHFMAEVRYKGTKVVSIAPDYAESSMFADTWISLKVGSDSAMAMAMGHVILKEYYIDKTVPFFLEYTRKYTDFPFLVRIEERNGGYVPGRMLSSRDMGRDEKHADFRYYVVDDKTGEIVIPNGTLAERWSTQEKWNIKEENRDTGAEICPRLSVWDDRTDTVEVELPYFGNDRAKRTLTRALPVRRVKTAHGEVLVTTVYDLTLANYAIDRGLGGESAGSYEDDTPYTPAWQEKYTGISPELVIHTARELADNAIKTNGRSMIIMGGGINHWFHADVVYRTIINLLLFTGCEGRNGGGWAHYVGQEKLRPNEGWARIMSGSDWQGPPKLLNSTSFYYFATNQWRSDEIQADALAAPNETARYTHPGDYAILAARLGWAPAYPTFNKGGQQIADEAAAAGGEGLDGVKDYIVKSLKDKSLKFAWEDPDAPENFPRNLFVWRCNLLGSSAKGNDYFLKYLLGTENSIFQEEDAKEHPREIKWREKEELAQPGGSLEGKLDLLVALDFRMAGNALYSDIVLPTATWYEKTDLSSTDMHPFVHPFQPAVDPLWESRTDWDIYRTLAQAVSEVAKDAKLTPYTNIAATPLGHDSEAELAQPDGIVRDWSKGECEPIPGKTMPNIAQNIIDYTKLYEKWIALGPNAAGKTASHGNTWDSAEDYEEVRARNGVIQNKDYVSYGMPSIYEARQAIEAVLGMSPTTNGRTAVRAWEAVEKRTGLTNLVRLAKDREEDRFTYDKVIAQPRQTITAPTFTGSNQNRRYTPFTTNVEELVPFRTLTGRQHFYMDHEVMREFGEAQAIYRPILDFRPMNKSLNGTQKEITLKYLTPHNKWSTHSMYFDAQQMLTMFRGGQSVWMSEKDAAEIGVKDNDWIELYNRNGVVASRVVVSPRIPQGAVFMHHAQDRHINVPGSKISGTRAGTHNTPTHIHMKPTHLIGGYGQLSYGFNYYGPTGNQRDSYVVVRRMEEVDWLED